MKTLFCMLSGQHIPNLLSVKHFQPDTLVLMESTQMREGWAADRFLTAIGLGGAVYQRRPVGTAATPSTSGNSDRSAYVIPLESVTSLSDVESALAAAFAVTPDAEWIVNLTGGNKLMTIAAYEYFKTRDCEMFYIEHNQPRLMVPVNRFTEVRCEHPLTIAEFLAGYGFEIKRPAADLAEQKRELDKRWEVARILTEYSTTADLLQLDRDESARMRGGKTVQLSSSRFSHLPQPVQDALFATFGKTADGGIQTTKANRGGPFLTGGWLEDFVAGLLSRHAAALQINDVQSSVMPFFQGSQTANDLDVAFIAPDLSLVMIECKSGLQDHDGAKDIFYKLDSVIGQSKALKARAILATTSDFLIDPKRGELTVRARELRDLLGLTIVTRDQLQALAANPDDAELVRRTFLR
jgi:hypothetical protein